MADRTRDQRIEDIAVLKTRVENLGLTPEMTQIAQLYAVFDRFIETGESDTGVISIPSIKRRIRYVLPRRKRNDLNLTLEYIG